MCVMCLSFSAAFNISAIFVFWHFDCRLLGYNFLCVYSACVFFFFLSCLNLWVNIFHHIWKTLEHFFLPVTPITHIILLSMLSSVFIFSDFFLSTLQFN